MNILISFKDNYCSEDEECVLQEVICKKEPCFPQPTCVPRNGIRIQSFFCLIVSSFFIPDFFSFSKQYNLVKRQLEHKEYFATPNPVLQNNFNRSSPLNRSLPTEETETRN